jgi:hypothetical protein
MRAIVAVVVLTLAAASPVSAQSQPDLPPNCQGFAAPPTLPDGATASAGAVAEADRRYRAWHEAGLAKLALCRGDIDVIVARLRAAEDAYNAGIAQINTTRDSWQAEADEYNARVPDPNIRLDRERTR